MKSQFTKVGSLWVIIASTVLLYGCQGSLNQFDAVKPAFDPFLLRTIDQAVTTSINPAFFEAIKNDIAKKKGEKSAQRFANTYDATTGKLKSELLEYVKTAEKSARRRSPVFTLTLDEYVNGQWYYNRSYVGTPGYDIYDVWVYQPGLYQYGSYALGAVTFHTNPALPFDSDESTYFRAGAYIHGIGWHGSDPNYFPMQPQGAYVGYPSPGYHMERFFLHIGEGVCPGVFYRAYIVNDSEAIGWTSVVSNGNDVGATINSGNYIASLDIQMYIYDVTE